MGNGHPDDVVPTTAIVPQAPVIDLNALGATVYQQSGFWGSNGDWSVSAHFALFVAIDWCGR